MVNTSEGSKRIAQVNFSVPNCGMELVSNYHFTQNVKISQSVVVCCALQEVKYRKKQFYIL